MNQTIWYDSEFVIKNLDTLSEKRYYLVQKVKGVANYGISDDGRVIIGENSLVENGVTDSGAIKISSDTLLGEHALGKSVGDVIEYYNSKDKLRRKRLRYEVVEIIGGAYEFSSNNNYDVLTFNEIVDYYNKAKSIGETLVLQRDFWSQGFVFAVEYIDQNSINGGVLYGKTFKDGKIYNHCAVYDGCADFHLVKDISVQMFYKTRNR